MSDLVKALLGIVDKDGNEWVVAGLFAAAHPVGRLDVQVELTELQQLLPRVTSLTVVTDEPVREVNGGQVHSNQALRQSREARFACLEAGSRLRSAVPRPDDNPTHA